MDFVMITSLPASDIDRARSWYEEKLGVTPVESIDDGALMYMQGEDSGFMVYPSQFAGTNQATAAGLAVKDFDAAIAELRANGVAFEEYDMGKDFRTVDGVVTTPDGRRSAWFKDSEGNILGIMRDPRA
jgi:predicted enzyme related to lactoylglutathione lyase